MCAPQESRFLSYWQYAQRITALLLGEGIGPDAALTEPATAHGVGEALPHGATLFAASSLPIRELDLFWRGTAARVRVLANRGANGIDGTLSSALGVAAGSNGPTVLLTGDLALFHDTSGLVLAAQSPGINLTVVVIDNGGGGIFEFLPSAQSVDRVDFEKHFITRQSVPIPGMIDGFGLVCHRVGTTGSLATTLGHANVSVC